MRYDEIRKIEELSEYVSDKYDVKVPITNIEKLVEKIGGTVVYENLGREHNHIIKTGNESFLIKIDNCYIQKDNKNNDKILKKMIADELGHLFLYMGYKTNNELWKSIPIKKEYHTHLQELDNILIFRDSLFMPRNDFTKIIEKYKTKDSTIDPQKIADYFHIGYGDAINRGRILGFFNI